jgi:hypothetical protein
MKFLLYDGDPSTGIITFGESYEGATDALNLQDPGEGIVLRAFYLLGVGVAPVDSDPFDVTAP